MWSDVQPRPARAADREVELARLRARLGRLPTHSAPPRRPAPPASLPLERIETPYGIALRRVEEIPLPPSVTRAVEPARTPGTVFLDTETTGLAGGTGTYVFLVGLGTWSALGLRVTQYFLGDLGAEAAFLAAVRDAVADARQIVTFNGRTFDLPLLETRYLLARAPWWGSELPHVDLYPLARALWRARVTDCRLTTLETALLDLDRGDDLPGAEMPRLYFRYLRTQDGHALPRIFAHNGWDLLALAALSARAEALLAGPDPRHDPAEWLGAARWLERRHPTRSASFYEAALDTSLPAAARLRAAWRLGRLWRRAGRAGDTLTLWTRVVESAAAPPLGLLVDLAKLQEHHARDPGAALALACRALARAETEGPEETRPLILEALRHRARRLERRLFARGCHARGAPGWTNREPRGSGRPGGRAG